MNSGREVIGRGRGRGLPRGNQAPERRDTRRNAETAVAEDKQFEEASTSSNESSLKGASAALNRDVTNADNAGKQFKLSVDAKEFYPKGYVQSQDHVVQGSCSALDDLSAVKSRLCELMTNLTRNPGDFDQSLNPLKETFTAWLQDPLVVHSIIDAIIEQSVTETNFRYNGARLCSFLYNTSSSIPCSEFRTYLISRCGALSSSTDSCHMHGLAIFLAELFMQLENAQGTGERIRALAEQLFLMLETLVSQAIAANAEAQRSSSQTSMAAAEAQGESLKCVCQALKLAGWQLEEINRPRTMQLTRNLVQAAGGPAGEKGVRRLANYVAELRRDGWGRGNSNIADLSQPLTSSCHAVESVSHNPHHGSWQSGGRSRGPCNYHSNVDEPVFYGPDGAILTAEESRFLQDSIAAICDEDDYGEGEWGDAWSDGGMDEEMEAAFEQFLQLGQKSTTA